MLLALGVFFFLSAPAAAQTPVKWSLARPVDARFAPGVTFSVSAVADIDAGWYIYDIAQAPGGPYPLELNLAPGSVFSRTAAITAPAPRRKFDTNFKMETATHHGRVAFVIPIRIADGAAPGSHTLRVVVVYQTCDDRICLPPQEEELTTEIVVAALGATTGSAPSIAPAAVPAAQPDSLNAVATAAARVPDLAMSSRASTFSAYLGLAIVMGALSLLTPCVFPMVPITVSYFTNRQDAGRQRHGSRRDAVSQATVYGAGIILTFTLVGFAMAVLFGASGLNQFAANPWLNLGIAALFIAFALSLFGVYELALPSRLLTVASSWDAGRGRYVGTLLMGLAFTLTSFTCTAPFLGTLLVVAAQGDWQWPLAGMLAFSTVFALPFVVLALAPRLLTRLPRSGMWLISVKAVMGLLELGAAVKFISNVDLVWGWQLFTREVVLVIWIAIAVWLAGYLGGWLRIGRVPRLRQPAIGRAIGAVASVALAIWLTMGLSGRRLGELEAFLPPADLAAMTPDGELPWIVNDYERAVADGAALNRPILIDFTGYTCTNCRWMEANMFTRPEVARELARFVRVRLYTDGRGEMYRRFQDMERSMFGTVALPYYAALDAAGQPVVGFSGLTRSTDEFVGFLRHGLSGQ
jgi:thiol:disulfide interchange protein